MCFIGVFAYSAKKAGNRMKFRAICENHLYAKAYSRGRRYVGGAVAVYVLPDYRAEKIRRARPQKDKINRIGLTVSKKLGGAVVRTRVRRILREAYRQVISETSLRPGHLIVVAAREPAVHMKSTRLVPELRRAFERLQLFSQS